MPVIHRLAWDANDAVSVATAFEQKSIRIISILGPTSPDTQAWHVFGHSEDDVSDWFLDREIERVQDARRTGPEFTAPTPDSPTAPQPDT